MTLSDTGSVGPEIFDSAGNVETEEGGNNTLDQHLAGIHCISVLCTQRRTAEFQTGGISATSSNSCLGFRPTSNSPMIGRDPTSSTNASNIGNKASDGN